MIVKNESKIITRLLNSTKDIIDSAMIVDTGSTDNTVSIIEQWLEDNNIEGRVVSKPWKNFGFNRSESYQLAREAYPDVTYYLTLDADFILKLDITKDELHNQLRTKARCYSILQDNKYMQYYNIRFLSSGYQWKCVGPTHEYWDTDPSSHSVTRLEGIKIDDINDGGSKSDKSVRDVRLLTEALDDPETDDTPGLRSRYLYYLARSKHDLGMFNEALSYFKMSADLTESPEEKYYSNYMIGCCLQNVGKYDEAIVQHLNAYSLRPSRFESLMSACALLRQKGQYIVVHSLLKQALMSQPPTYDILFVDTSLREYKALMEMSFVAYRCGMYKDGYEANLRLLSNRDLSEQVHATARGDIKFYEDALKIPESLRYNK